MRKSTCTRAFTDAFWYFANTIPLDSLPNSDSIRFRFRLSLSVRSFCNRENIWHWPFVCEYMYCFKIYACAWNIFDQGHVSPVKRICVFEHSVMTNFNCACPAIQRGQESGFLSEGSSWLTACMSEQRRFWRDCADAQARLNLRCSHRR